MASNINISVWKVKQSCLTFQKVQLLVQHCCVPLCINPSRYNATVGFNLSFVDSVRAQQLSKTKRIVVTPATGRMRNDVATKTEALGRFM